MPMPPPAAQRHAMFRSSFGMGEKKDHRRTRYSASLARRARPMHIKLDFTYLCVTLRLWQASWTMPLVL
jgi:hypothetical protein